MSFLRIVGFLALCLAPTVGAEPVVVGSKAFTESVILAEVLAQLVRRENGTVEHRREIGGSPILWRALQRGDIDAYVEYSGTLTGELLPKLAGASEETVVATLRELGIGASGLLGFEDKYALGMQRERAKELKIRSIEDLAAHPDLRLGFSHEFLDRREGWPAIREAYRLPHKDVRGIQHVLAYQAMTSGSLDVLDLYTTDAEIEALDLVALHDSRHVFPEYEARVLFRADAFEKNEPLRRALTLLEGSVDEDTMIAMNKRAKIDKVSETTVAADWIARRWGGDAGTVAQGGLVERVWLRTKEHLALVGLAMLVTLLVAIPLGIVAVRRPRLGAALLGVAGVLQTIPSLALLVFLVPLLGIGFAPAFVALFLYGLLPVMRNTALGLQSVPASLDESARALGLSARARLFRIELPLASPAIVAGIKTATVLAVGTATLGALIGAGGYGEPILVGLRRDELSQTLEGAIPAALLAILVQAAFVPLERVLVPRGLRLKSQDRGE